MSPCVECIYRRDADRRSGYSKCHHPSALIRVLTGRGGHIDGHAFPDEGEIEQATIEVTTLGDSAVKYIPGRRFASQPQVWWRPPGLNVAANGGLWAVENANWPHDFLTTAIESCDGVVRISTRPDTDQGNTDRRST